MNEMKKKRMRVTWVYVFACIKNTKGAFKNPTCSILFEANRWLAVHMPLTSSAHATALHQANDPVDLLPRRTMNAANSPPQLLLCPSTYSSIPDQQTSLMPSGP